MTALPQRRTQEILETVLSQLGIGVERGITFERFQRRGTQLACRVSGAGGDDIIADRLLGCDGAHSRVRTCAGIDFRGRSYQHHWTLADVAVDWPFPPDEAVFSFTTQGALFAIPLAPGVYRLVRNGPEPTALVPPGARINHVMWSSSFRINHRLAERFSATGVFLAGDAAHVHSPAGARGMNGGIEDAATFAWLVASGHEARYERLRRPAARVVMRQVDRQTRQAEIADGIALALREAVAHLALPRAIVQTVAARFITALDQPAPAWLQN